MGGCHVTFCFLFLMLIPGIQAAVATLPDVQDARGKEFIIGFMENKLLEETDPGEDIEMFVSTLAEFSDVKVTLPKFDPDWVKVVRVFRGFAEMITVPHAVIAVGTEKAGKGVHIEATEEVIVSVVNKERLSTDAYLALPVDALDTEYFAITYNRRPEILVAATQDNTQVSITLPADRYGRIEYNGVKYASTDTLTVTLDKYEIFHAFDDRGTKFADFTGTHIVASHPVTVISGNQKVKVPSDSTGNSGDHLTECLLPVVAWGREFPIFNTADRTGGDVYRIVAAYNNTVVTFTGSGNNISLNAGQSEEFSMPPNTEEFLTSTKPIEVALFSYSFADDGPRKGDPAMTIIPPIEQVINEHDWATVTTPEGRAFSNKVTVVIETAKVAGLRIDGAVQTWERNEVIPGTVYSHLWGYVEDGVHNVYHVQPNVGFIVIASGTAPLSSYAFPGNARVARINQICDNTIAVDGDGVDNDCDGRIDEELPNDRDDDGDGSVDEDTCLGVRVDGEWSDWGPYGACSVTCDTGFKSRTRSCDDPAPANGGLPCPGSPVEFAACDMPPCTGGTGPLCGQPARHCISTATCENNTCVCPNGTEGDPTFHCYPTGMFHCTSELDPEVITYDGASTHVNLPCRYRVGMVETDVINPPDQMFDKCRVTVMALNYMDTGDYDMFVWSMEVKVDFVRYNAQNETVFHPSSDSTFLITQQNIEDAVPGTNPWLQSFVTENNVLMLPTWDSNNNIAVLNIPQCDVQTQFRVFDVNQYIQEMKSGVSLVAPPGARFDNLPGFSVCGRPGDGASRFMDLAKEASLEGPQTAMLFSILTDAAMDQNISNPFFQAECSNLQVTAEDCEVSRRPLAFNLCNRIVNYRQFLTCIDKQGVNPLETFNQCLQWVCDSDTAACTNYYGTLVDGNCPLTERMLAIGCNVTALNQALQ